MQKNKLSLVAIAVASAMILSACGGGGGDSAASTGSGTALTPPQQVPPQQVNPNDPYTGKPASGTMTNQISGSVINGPTAGATVAAYLLNPDGSNGASLGQATTDANGAFSMTLSQVPSGMIRLVATGGTFKSGADASTQKNELLELVAPYMTSGLSTFVITPLTHAASQRIVYLAGKEGKALADAYTSGSSGVLQLVTGNNVIASADRSHGGVDYLSIVPGSAQDTLGSYADALTAIEYYGVNNDLPSHVVVRVLAQSNAATGGPSTTGIDGQPINVGKWAGTAFDETASFALSQLSMGFPNTDMQVIVQAMAAIPACQSGDHSYYYKRFPLATGDSDYLDTVACGVTDPRLMRLRPKQLPTAASSTFHNSIPRRDSKKVASFAAFLLCTPISFVWWLSTRNWRTPESMRWCRIHPPPTDCFRHLDRLIRSVTEVAAVVPRQDVPPTQQLGPAGTLRNGRIPAASPAASNCEWLGYTRYLPPHVRLASKELTVRVCGYAVATTSPSGPRQRRKKNH